MDVTFSDGATIISEKESLKGTGRVDDGLSPPVWEMEIVNNPNGPMIAVMGPMGHDECAHYLFDGLAQCGANVRAIDPIPIRDTLRRLYGTAETQHYSCLRKPVSLQLLKDNPSPRCDITDCSIILITDMYFTMLNDLNPMDEVGNRPLVIFYHNEIDQPPACTTANLVCYGQEPIKNITHAMYCHEFAYTKHEFMLYPAAFPERHDPTREKKYPGISWIGDNLIGVNGTLSRVYGRNHLLAQHNTETYQAKLDDAKKILPPERFIEEDPSKALFLTRPAYLDILEQCQAHLIIFPDRVYWGRRLFECIACGAVPVIHVQSKQHAELLEAAGFLNGVNCLTYTDARQLKVLDQWVRQDLETNHKITDEALKLLKERHTYKHRGQEILGEIDLWRRIVVNILEGQRTGIELPIKRGDGTINV